MFYAFYDNQTGRYMSSGLNCTSKEEAIGQMASYLSIDTDKKTIRVNNSYQISKHSLT